MKVQILETFERFPTVDDKAGKAQAFFAGQTIDVSDEDGRLFVEKGHAREVGGARVEAVIDHHDDRPTS